MLLGLLFNIPSMIIGWFLGFLKYEAFSLGIASGFRLIFGYGVYLMGDSTFLAVTGCILFWSGLQFTLSIIKFIIWICPFIG